MRMYDPPLGWKYGFPKEYKPHPADTIEETLVRDGYPQEMIDKIGDHLHVRFWETEKITPFEAVLEFHKTYGVLINQDFFNTESLSLREHLIQEEYHEVVKEINPFFIAIENSEPDPSSFVDKKALTKELADLLYVTIGTAVTFGLPLEEVFYEVHKSNMSKLGEDGKPIYREDGKVLKGPNYKEPDLEKFFK